MTRGHLHVSAADRGAAALRAVFPVTGGEAGLGVAVTGRPSPEVTETVCAATGAWLAATGRARTVLLAAPRSFCAGVERAIEIVERLLAQRGGPIYVRKEIVHNGTSSPGSKRGARCSSRSWTRCRAARSRCSPRTGSPPPSARRRNDGGSR
ncbi:hypothetical protein GCM10017788_69470 [Amycolatopsis acidiphila]|nr:hypothetical protein [Amycolatopsis acidiphila]GHG92605.1 hypothetical protein GCM10017788_69470 [Amycolatopsis acidiphila]